MQNNFLKDVEEGLSAQPKHLSSLYFYDDIGSKLFQQIMQSSDYYVTDCEYEIFFDQSEKIVDAMSKQLTESGVIQNKKIRLIDFGAGDGVKTELLLEGFKKIGVEAIYTPVDISEEALRSAEKNIKRKLPEIKIEPLKGEYFEALKQIDNIYTRLPMVIIFLGSNIGNFSHKNTINFLTNIQQLCSKEDKLFIGFDLKKNPQTILNAYSDKEGITRKFNLNLLSRINRELKADFNLKHFDHYANYDPISGTARSYIISLKKQEIQIPAFDNKILFDRFEPLFVEQSQKYDRADITQLASETQFNVLNHFSDSKNFFIDSLWETK